MRRIGTVLFSVAALTVVSAAAAQSAAAPTLATSANAIEFGSSITLHGSAPGAAAGDEVQILMQACGFTGPVPVGHAKATAQATYSYTLQPLLNATIEVQVGDETSNAARVTVRPLVQVRSSGHGSFRVDVSVGNGAFFTKTVSLQRYDRVTKSWKLIGSATLKANSDPGALVAVSSATVHARVAQGSKVRAVVSQATVGSCYRPSTSASITA